jgi:hypothetical protein
LDNSPLATKSRLRTLLVQGETARKY